MRSSRRVSRARSPSKYSETNFTQHNPKAVAKGLGVGELVDFNDDVLSVLSGKSIARSVVSKADTMLCDELMDL